MRVHTILLSGKQGAGKTTLAKALCAEVSREPGWYAHNLFFAEPLYKMHDFCWGYLKDHGIEMPYKKDGYLLQLLGTEWGRGRVSENIWVDLLKAKLEKLREGAHPGTKGMVFVVSDCRFPNELEIEAVKVRLECPAIVRRGRVEMWRDTENHESEIALDSYTDWDMKINTEKTSVEASVSLILTRMCF